MPISSRTLSTAMWLGRTDRKPFDSFERIGYMRVAAGVAVRKAMGEGTMINTHINQKKGAPWWAAVGAPLVGVSLMVALLALASPKEKAPVGEADTGVRAEQVEPQVVHPAELEAEYVHVLFDAGVIGVGPERELIGANGRLRSTRRHKPSPEHFKYHRMIHGLQD